jgi:hypothetical protein
MNEFFNFMFDESGGSGDLGGGGGDRAEKGSVSGTENNSRSCSVHEVASHSCDIFGFVQLDMVSFNTQFNVHVFSSKRGVVHFKVG